MKPEDVNPKNFKVINIVYDNSAFSIAYGIWEDGVTNLAMRWNGESDKDPGYPKLFQYPVWFIITKELMIPILTSIINQAGSYNVEILEVLNKELK
jgi:hypothetical protein